MVDPRSEWPFSPQDGACNVCQCHANGNEPRQFSVAAFLRANRCRRHNPVAVCGNGIARLSMTE
jgi:hypothetical protein